MHRRKAYIWAMALLRVQVVPSLLLACWVERYICLSTHHKKSPLFGNHFEVVALMGTLTMALLFWCWLAPDYFQEGIPWRAQWLGIFVSPPRHPCPRSCPDGKSAQGVDTPVSHRQSCNLAGVPKQSEHQPLGSAGNRHPSAAQDSMPNMAHQILRRAMSALRHVER
jgi:hypothetical protein